MYKLTYPDGREVEIDEVSASAFLVECWNCGEWVPCAIKITPTKRYSEGGRGD